VACAPDQPRSERHHWHQSHERDGGSDWQSRRCEVLQSKLTSSFLLATQAHFYLQNISHVYVEKWEEFGISRDGTHAKLAYDWYGSWTTLYNLYADALLCFHLDSTSSDTPAASVMDGQKPLKPGHGHSNRSKTGFVPQHIYKIQSDWYYTVRQKYGLPLDSRHLYTKTDWEFFAAAVMSKKVRGAILESVALWVNETVTGKRCGFPASS